MHFASIDASNSGRYNCKIVTSDEVTITVTNLAGKVLLRKNYDRIEKDLVYQADLSAFVNDVYLMMIDKVVLRIVKN